MIIKETLVDRLTGVHKGDMVLLNGSRAPIIGFVHDYSMETISLGIEMPYEMLSQDQQNKLTLCGNRPTTFVRNPVRKYHLKYFDSYTILVPKEK